MEVTTADKRLKLTLIVAFIVVIITVALLISNKKFEGDWLGVSVHFLSENDAQVVKESEADWIRIDCSEAFGTACENAKTFGLKVLGILDSWTMNYLTIFSLEEWRRNVTYYVSTYADYVDAWEIWNEPANPTSNWTLLNAKLPDNMTQIVQFYSQMVQVAASIIRQYDPTAKIVLFGGLNLWSGNAPNLGLDKVFATRLAAMDIAQYGDAFSVHAYPWTEMISSWDFSTYDNALSYYKGLFPSLEIWVTETGYNMTVEGEEAQARYLQSAIQYFNGQNVTRIFWYSLLDNPEEGSFGLLGSDGRPRQAYYKLQEQLG